MRRLVDALAPYADRGVPIVGLEPSCLFTLNDDEEKDIPKLYVMVSTQPEFAGRPAVGSVYSVCWVFKQGRGYLGYLLARDLGTVSVEDVEGLVDKLVGWQTL